MNLLDLIKKHGKVELSLVDPDKANVNGKVLVVASRGGHQVTFEVEQIDFATGGAILLVHEFE